MGKKLYRTKTFWGGLAAIVTGAGLIATGNIPQGVNAIVTGLLAVFLRDGIRSLPLPEAPPATEPAPED